MNFYQEIISLGEYSSAERLQFKLESIFEQTDFKGKIVLDIGGGAGLFSFYAAYRGAKKVICLEPEVDGSIGGLPAKFGRMQDKLRLQEIHFIPAKFQDFEPKDIFDIIISHNSINHLDEDACTKINQSSWAQSEYRRLFLDLKNMTKAGAHIIICDCSNSNFFDFVGLKNPFVPNIEWEKHQSPKTWIKLLEESGFQKLKVKWSSFNRLGKYGKALLGNAFISYFLTSHFCLYARRC